ncbi:MAG: hypothetical protein EPO11_06960 [Gammaproteobacteria bacterium]|nr:MAG: hypothetical protein EPO11_06960 [Gammaproteobacteria bacterium]
MSSHATLNINPQVKTAIIYSLDDLCGYSVEIKYQGKSHYLTKNDHLIIFGNMKDAREAVINEKAQVAYLALSKTMEEPDLSTCHTRPQDQYDYSLIKL